MVRLALLLGALLVPTGGVWAFEITFLTHNIADTTYVDAQGQLRGKPHGGRRSFNIELIREMMQMVKHPVRFEILPFPRALNLIIANHKPYALFNIGRRPSREGKMKWVGPLQTDKIYFWENRTRPTGIQSLADAKRVEHICVILGSFHYQTLSRAGFTNLHQNVDYKSCFKMLAIGRTDLTVVSHHSIREILAQAEIPEDLIQSTGVLLSETEGYLVFSNMVPDAVVRKWQRALDTLKQSGRYDQLARAYLYP